MDLMLVVQMAQKLVAEMVKTKDRALEKYLADMSVFEMDTQLVAKMVVMMVVRYKVA